MGILIDSSILIDHERGRLDIGSRIASREDESFFLSVITASELLHGVHRAADPLRRAKRSAFVEAILDDFPVLGIDLPTARSHAGLWAELASRGALIGAHDLWLAAVAVARDLTLVTMNVRDFGRVPGLTVEDWS
ncbi:MAG: type II toxin-antitoxin system VapC family toxin [Gemmatimonadota bacterium]